MNDLTRTNIRIVASCDCHRCVDSSVADLISVLKNNNVGFTGPIPLPTCLVKFRGKPSNVIHRRLLDINSETCPECIENMNIPIGVKVEVKVVCY